VSGGGQIGNLAKRRRSRLLVECHPGRRVLVREHHPERGPVPSTSILGNARRSRSLRCCRIRSASVSGLWTSHPVEQPQAGEHRQIAEPIEKPGTAGFLVHTPERVPLLASVSGRFRQRERRYRCRPFAPYALRPLRLSSRHFRCDENCPATPFRPPCLRPRWADDGSVWPASSAPRLQRWSVG
jgi:hypothetical protein